jgi:hypothetical protein
MLALHYTVQGQSYTYNQTVFVDTPVIQSYGWGLRIKCLNDTNIFVACRTLRFESGKQVEAHNYWLFDSSSLKKTIRLKHLDTAYRSSPNMDILWLTENKAIEMLHRIWYTTGNGVDTLHAYPVMQFLNYSATTIDTNFTKAYANNFENVYCNLVTTDNKLFSTGMVISPLASGNDIAITCFDTLGNVIWHRTTGIPNRMDRGLAIACLGQDKLLIAAVCNQLYTSNGNQYTKNRIYCYDTAGNELWYKDLWENNASLYIAMAPCATENKKFYFSTWRDTILSLPNNGYGGVFELSMLDSLANPLWTHMFTELPSELMGIYNIKALANGNVMLCGSISDKQGWACQMRPDASIVWQHTYTSSSTSNFNILTNCDRAPNGDFVFCGTSIDSTYNRQATWILRVDSNGCLVPSACSPLGAVQYDIAEPLRINAYPNPAADNLYLQSNSTQHLLSGKVQVFNLQGQQLYSQAVEGITMHNVGLQNLAAGTYLWRYESKRGEVISSKFVKN